VSVEDNGRGIPVGMHEKEKVPAAEVVLTKLHAGGKFDNDSYKVSGGLHGVGISVVNALAKQLEARVKRGGKVYEQKYERGKVASELRVAGTTQRTGTRIRFLPDPEIFEDLDWNFDTLAQRLRELSFLNAGVQITLEDVRTNKKSEYSYKGGIASFIDFLNESKKPLHKKIIHVQGNREDVDIDIALQYNDGYTESVFSYVNNINTREGGTHLSGFRAALTRTLNSYAASNNLFKKNAKASLSGEDMREGLTAIVSVKLPDPKFGSQTKDKLVSSEVRQPLESLMGEKMSEWLEENPNDAKARDLLGRLRAGGGGSS
jgi:DNA gyrase subunit B